MQLKKILAAGSLAALMAGSSIAFAATLADYPAPFVSGGAADYLIVVGSQGTDPAGLASDVAGAIDVSTRLGGEVYTAVTVGASTAGVTISGEGKALQTTNTKIYINDTLAKSGLRSTMTSQDLPILLKKQNLLDSDSGSYNYDSYIDFSAYYAVLFAQNVPASTLTPTDPAMVIKHTAGATNPTSPASTDYMYRTRVVFEKPVKDSARTQTLKLFGKEYTISTDSNFTATDSTAKLVLFGSSNTQVLSAKVPVTVTISGTDYTVELVGTTSSTTAVVNVNGVQDSITQGATKTINGLQIYMQNVYQFSTTDQTQNQAKVGIGAETITFPRSGKVYTGSGSTTNIDGTWSNLTTTANGLTAMEIYIVPAKASADALKEGESFTDPIFGTFGMQYTTATTDLTDASRDVLDIKASGDKGLSATFTDDRSNTRTFVWAYDSATTGAASVDLEDSSGFRYVVQENLPIYLNQYAVVDSGGYTHLIQLVSLSNDGTTNGYIELQDKFSDAKYKFILGTANQTIGYIDGQAYYIDGTASVNYIKMAWGDGAGYNSVGSQITVYPTIKGKNGEKIALMNQTDVTISDGLQIDLPTGRVTLSKVEPGAGDDRLTFTAASGYAVSKSGALNTTHDMNISDTSDAFALAVGKTTTGAFYYNISVATANTTIRIKPAGYDAIANINPAIILVEEADKDGNVYSVQVEATNETSGSTLQTMANSPDFTNLIARSSGTGTAQLKTDTYKYQYLDLYGLFAEKNIYAQDSVKFWYPDEQMTNDVVVLTTGATTSISGGTSGTTVHQVAPLKTSVARLDTDIGDTEKNTKNLILVGDRQSTAS